MIDVNVFPRLLTSVMVDSFLVGGGGGVTFIYICRFYIFNSPKKYIKKFHIYLRHVRNYKFICSFHMSSNPDAFFQNSFHPIQLIRFQILSFYSHNDSFPI